MTKFFSKVKKHCFSPFLAHFAYFWDNIVTHNFIYVSSTMPKFKKTNDTNPIKRPDRLKDRRTDSPYFIGPFWLAQGVQNKSIKKNARKKPV